MKKNSILYLFFILILIFSLTACGSKDNENTNAPTKEITATPVDSTTPAATSTSTPEPTEAPEVTETPEITEVPEETPTPEPTEEPTPVVENNIYNSLLGMWYLVESEVEGYESTVYENGVLYTLNFKEDYTVDYEANSTSWESPNSYTNLPVEVLNDCIRFTFMNGDTEESVECQLISEGQLVASHLFYYDETIPVVSTMYMNRDEISLDYLDAYSEYMTEAYFIPYTIGLAYSNDIYDENENYIGQVRIPVFQLSEEINPLSYSKLISLNNSFIEEGREKYEEFLNSTTSGDSLYQLYLNYLSVVRSDSKIFSAYSDAYTLVNSTDESYTTRTYNYDIQYGKRITTNDAIWDKEVASNAVIQKLQEKYPDVEFNTNLNEIAELDELPFVIGYNGVIFYFSAGNIADVEYGSFIVYFSFDECSEWFNSSYTVAATDYTCHLDFYTEYYLDINNDGIAEDIMVIPSYDDYDDLLGFSIYADYEEICNYTLEDSAWNTNVVFVKYNDNAYFYFDSIVSSDDNELLIFRANGLSVEYVDTDYISLDGPDMYLDLDENIAYYIDYIPSYSLSSPYNFLIKERNDYLGTTFVTMRMYIDEDGHLLPVYPYSWYDDDFSLVTLEDITVTRYDYNSWDEESVETVIPAGTTIYPKLIYVGGVLEFETDDDYVYSIDLNTLDVSTTFDGIIYAD